MNNNPITYVILSVSIISALLPLMIGKRDNNPLLWTYILAGFCFDISITVFKRLIHVDWFDYHWLGVIYFAVEFVFISLYYNKYIFKHKSIFITILLAGLLFYSITTINSETFTHYGLNGIGAGAFLLAYITYSLAGFHKILKEQTIVRLERSPFFWINTAFLIYAAGSIVVFVCLDFFLVENKMLIYTLWVFRNTLNVIKNVIFAKALTLRE